MNTLFFTFWTLQPRLCVKGAIYFVQLTGENVTDDDLSSRRVSKEPTYIVYRERDRDTRGSNHLGRYSKLWSYGCKSITLKADQRLMIV